MVEQSIKQLLQNAAVDKRASWAIVRNGAVAEFSITEQDIAQRKFDFDSNTLTVQTNKAILEIQLNDKLIAVIAENANYRCSPWSQNIYLCIPIKESELPSRNKLTRIGEYQSNGISGMIWDLGIGYNDFQAKIITDDVNLQYLLKQKDGQFIIDDMSFLKKIIEFSPIRAFNSKYASIIVKQRIPTKKDEVDGPHTHLLPNIILRGISFPIPIDDDLSSQIQVDPFGGVIDGNGNHNEWKGFEKDDFQQFLKIHGDKTKFEDKIALKNKLCDFLQRDDFQSISDLYTNDKMQDPIRIILAQIVCDKYISPVYRRKGFLALERLKAINYHVLKNWTMRMSPEILNENNNEVKNYHVVN
jgi:hypothetical protein